MRMILEMSDEAVRTAIGQIAEIHGEVAQLPQTRDRGEAGVIRRRLYEEMFAIQRQIATEFGRRRGWIKSRARFWGPAILARRSITASSLHPGEVAGLEHDLFDHSYCYRDSGRPFRAAAIAAHLYNNSADRPDNLVARARIMGLSLSWPDFPSWHYPGRTALALYVPADPPLRLVA